MDAARFAAVVVLATVLASCGGGQLGNPNVQDMDPIKARDMTQQYCQDISSKGQDKATLSFAAALAAREVTQRDQDAMVEFAYYKLCPKNF